MEVAFSRLLGNFRTWWSRFSGVDDRTRSTFAFLLKTGPKKQNKSYEYCTSFLSKL